MNIVALPVSQNMISSMKLTNTCSNVLYLSFEYDVYQVFDVARRIWNETCHLNVVLLFPISSSPFVFFQSFRFIKHSVYFYQYSRTM